MAAKGIAHREWAIHRSEYDTDQDFRAAVEQEQALNVHIQERLGVAIVSAPARRREGSLWFTTAYVFKTATVPAVQEATDMVGGVFDDLPEVDEPVTVPDTLPEDE